MLRKWQKVCWSLRAIDFEVTILSVLLFLSTDTNARACYRIVWLMKWRTLSFLKWMKPKNMHAIQTLLTIRCFKISQKMFINQCMDLILEMCNTYFLEIYFLFVKFCGPYFHFCELRYSNTRKSFLFKWQDKFIFLR